MTASNFTHLAITCPHCEQANNLSAANLPEDSQVNCSHCGAEVGTFADLKRGASNQAQPGSEFTEQ